MDPIKDGDTSRISIPSDNLNSDTRMQGQRQELGTDLPESDNMVNGYKISLQQVRSSPMKIHKNHTSRDNDRDNLASLSSSPVRKSVVFSDQLESSPPAKIVDSSYSQRHIRSILRSSQDTSDIPSDSVIIIDTGKGNSVTNSKETKVETHQIKEDHTVESGYPFIKISPPFIAPDSIEYWVKGEIHSLTEDNNVDEFGSIINGGLKILSNSDPLYRSRWFEVYATFNNIISAAINSLTQLQQQQQQQQNNSQLRRISRGIKLNNRKLSILVENMPNFMTVCISHLENESKTLLSSSPSKRNPFSTRLFVQIIRLFGSFLSNITLTRHLRRSEEYLRNCKRVYQCLIDSLGSGNLSKSVSTALLLFFKNEKFGNYVLTQGNLTDMLVHIVQLDCGRSKYLGLEKLLVIKSLLNKYPTTTLEHADIWLPTEILPWFLINDGVLGSKMIVTSISTLLDFLKKTLEVDIGYRLLYASVEEKPVTEVLPGKYLSVLTTKNEAAGSTRRDLASTTIGSLLRRYIKELALGKKEYKLSFDLWLATVGILYNSREGLERLIRPTTSDNWIRLNVSLLKSGDASVPLFALKVWRVLIYCVCRLVAVTSDNARQRRGFLLLLQRPFSVAATRLDNQYVREGVVYLLNGVTFASVGACLSDRGNGTELFPIFWNYTLKNIFNTMFKMAEGEGLPVRVRVVNILLRLLGSKDQLDGDIGIPQNGKHSTQRHTNLHIVRVIASTGISLDDIRQLPGDLLEVGFPHFLRLIDEFISSDPTGYYTDKLLLALLASTPPDIATAETLASLTDMLLKLTKQRRDAGVSNPPTFQSILQFTCLVFKKFYKPKNLKDNMLVDYLVVIGQRLSTQDGTNNFLSLFQAVIKKTRDEKIPEFWVMEKFLRAGDYYYDVREYITNWLNTALLSPEMSKEDKFCLTGVISLIPTDEVIENFSTLVNKKPFVGTNFYHTFNLERWDANVLLKFLTSLTKLKGGVLEYITTEFLQQYLSKNFGIRVINILVPFLLVNNFGNPNTSQTILAANIDDLMCDLKDFSIIFWITLGIYGMQHSEPDRALKYLDCILSQFKKTKMGESMTNSNNNNKDPGKAHDNDINFYLEKFLAVIFELSTNNKWWSILGKIISWCAEENKIGLIEPLINKDNKAELLHLKPRTLAAVASKVNGFDEIVKLFFSRGDNAEKMELLEELICLESSEAIFRLRKTICKTLLNFQDEVDGISTSTRTETFRKLSDLVVPQDEKLLYGFLDTLISLLPKKFDVRYTPFVRHYIYLMESRNNSTIKNKKTFDRLLQILYGWANLEGDTSGPHKDVEIPATQESSREENSPPLQSTLSDSMTVHTKLNFRGTTLSNGNGISETPSHNSEEELPSEQLPKQKIHFAIESLISSRSKVAGDGGHHSAAEAASGEYEDNISTEVLDSFQSATTNISAGQHTNKVQVTKSSGQEKDDESTILVNKNHIIGIPIFRGSRVAYERKSPSNSEIQENNIQMGGVCGEDTVNKTVKTSIAASLSNIEGKTGPAPPSEVGADVVTSVGDNSVRITSVDDAATDQGTISDIAVLKFNLGSKTVLTGSSETIKITQSSQSYPAEVGDTNNKNTSVSGAVVTEDESPKVNNESKRSAEVLDDSTQGLKTKKRKSGTSYSETQTAERETSCRIDPGIPTVPQKKIPSDEADDDFMPVQATEEDDEFLETLSKSISNSVNGAASITKPVSIKNEEPEVKIKFPIFNSLKLLQRAKEERENERNSTELIATVEDAGSASADRIENVNDKPEIGIASDESALHPKPVDSPDNNEGDNKIDAEPTVETTARATAEVETSPSPSNYFPTKKIRRLVGKLRSLSSNDLSKVGIMEKRNLRIELLDFLMKMEYHMAGDESQ